MTTVPAPGVLEGQTVTADLDLSADVCIMGSGAGGAVTAATLAAAGLKVVVLEEGGYYTKERFRMLEAEAYPALYQSGATLTSKDLSVSILQGKAVGGSTVVNWTTCFRTPEHVVDHWRRHWGLESITAEQLDPFFARSEKRLHVHAVTVASFNRNNRLLYDGCKALGWEAEPIRRNVKGCAQTGACGLGCPIDAKQSMLVSYLPDAMNQGATVISRCRVEKLITQQSEVTTAEAKFLTSDGTRPTGKKLTIKAKHFICCAGAIGSPSLLMRSGIEDQSGMLGRRTFLHPVTACAGRYDEPVDAFYGAPQSASSHQFSDRGDEVGFFMEAAPAHPGLAATIVPGFGAEHRKEFKRLPFFAAHIALTIDGFHDDVEGGQVELDRDGLAVLDYVVPERVWRAMREANKVLARIQFATGAKWVTTCRDPDRALTSEKDVDLLDDLPYEPNRAFATSAHVMGGCLMSDDPSVGVVRGEDLRHHAIKNLHIVDGSVFPTSLGVNPQLSIYGLAGLVSSRLAEAWA